MLLLPGIVGRQGCTDQDGQLQHSARHQLEEGDQDHQAGAFSLPIPPQQQWEDA